MGIVPTYESDIARFMAKVKTGAPGECWLWTAGLDSSGYGAFSLRGRDIRASRAAWILLVGPIPRGLWVLHSCDNPPCVNPAHLWLGTHTDNMRDASAKGRLWTASACPKGHARNYNRQGKCRDCARIYHRGYRARQAQAH